MTHELTNGTAVTTNGNVSFWYTERGLPADRRPVRA